jgi:hypothetical protein
LAISVDSKASFTSAEMAELAASVGAMSITARLGSLSDRCCDEVLIDRNEARWNKEMLKSDKMDNLIE